MSYSVVIVDDEKMVINSLALGFDWSETDFEVIATFQNSKEALEQIILLKPDVVFSDIKMPGLNGLDMMAQIRMSLPSIKFVFISGYEDFTYASKALSLGASGYCLKPLEDEKIHEVLRNIKAMLIETQNNLDALFYSLLQNTSNECLSLFMNALTKQYQFSDSYCIAASIYDISSEFRGYIPYIKVKYEQETYFYFTPDLQFLASPGLNQRIRHAIHNKMILNYSYIRINSQEHLAEGLVQLLNHVYSFFFQMPTTTFHYEISTAVKSRSSFFGRLEDEYCKDNLIELMELLKNYPDLYPQEDRTITEAIRIYNLVMAALYRKENTYFDETLIRPHDLTSNFKSFGQMISYLVQTISEQNSSYGKKNFSMIKNDTFKQILSYINQNFSKQISFQKICQEYSINPSYLSQVFQRELNTTFTNYLIDLRINYAKDLLAHTNILIAEVSEKVGYDQYFYFSKIFKKVTSLSPSQYRDQAQSKK